MQQIAVLGAAFDPPTIGHKDVVEQCLEHFSEVWLVPSFKHAFNKEMSDYSLRVQMAELFVQAIGNKNVKLMACEHLIVKAGPIYSLDLMNFLKANYTGDSTRLRLIIGPDNQQNFHRFYQHEILNKQFKPFVVKERINVRSTDVRAAIKQKKNLKSLVLKLVSDFIVTHHLYS